MAKSKVRADAKKKKQAIRQADLAERRAEKEVQGAAARPWVPWVFVPAGLLGVLWMVTYQLAGQDIGFMRSLGDWNMLVGIGLIVASFFLMTFWK